MSAIEQEILAIVQTLNPEQKQRVLEFARRLLDPRPFDATELMAMRKEERDVIIAAAANEDFEIF